jgi:GMP synthase (glutamine-hydrolysing)
MKASQSYANYRGQFVIEEMQQVGKPGKAMSQETDGKIPYNEGQNPTEMMHKRSRILLVDLCYEKDSLSQYEFVHPIRDTLQKLGFLCNILHYTEVKPLDLANHDKIILCGTALMDNVYAEHLELFSWIKDCKKPILGICAGMQVISAVYGGSIVPNQAIGLEEKEVVRASLLLGEPRQIEVYHLHNYAVTLPEGFQQLAGRTNDIEAFLHYMKPIFGVLFHPEVRNRWILDKFAYL